MKNRISCMIIGLITAVLCLVEPVNGITDEENIELIPAAATAYCDHGTTSTNTQTRLGICASSKDRYGKVIILYQRLPDGSIGDFIGMYECQDTGGKNVSNGSVIDIWKPDLAECQEFMNRVYEDNCKGKVYIQIVDGQG